MHCRLVSMGLVSALLLLAGAGPAPAFEVFCVDNNDGTTSCEGWQGGETLTCVGSRGGVSSCSTPSGRRFTCVIEPGAVTSCRDHAASRTDQNGTNCTFTGDGNFSCEPPRPRSEPLLPGPTLPSLPRTEPVITNPSVFGP